MSKKSLEIKIAGGLHEEGLYIFRDGVFYRAQQEPQISIPRPGEGFFRERSHGNATDQLMMEPQPVFELDDTVSPGTDHVGIDYPESGGTFVHLKGLLFPTKGFPFPEALQAVNVFKRALVFLIKGLVVNKIHLLSLLRVKNLQMFLDTVYKIGNITMKAYFPAQERYSRASRAIKTMVDTFFFNLGVEKRTSSGLGLVVATVFEYDNAYMFRIQDLANETSWDKLSENPSGEMIRLFNILKQRDKRPTMHDKMGNVVWLLRVAMWIPVVRMAFIKAISAVDWKDIQMDEGDRYHVCRWISYDFFGEPFEVRGQRFIDMHGGQLPPSFTLQTQ